MNRSLSGLVMTFALVASGTVLAAGTTVKGHQKYDRDGNGIPDAGVMVNGHYTSIWAVDAYGDFYWDLGDGRVYTAPGIESIDDLEADTLTVCNYENNYRADFGNDPYMDTGWIINSINCVGYENGHYLYLIVHEDDPRYQGNPDFSIWGSWEYKVWAESGSGNAVYPFTKPENHVAD